MLEHSYEIFTYSPSHAILKPSTSQSMLLLPCTIVGQPENTQINPTSGLKHNTIELKACSSYMRNKTCFKKEFAASNLYKLGYWLYSPAALLGELSFPNQLMFSTNMAARWIRSIGHVRTKTYTVCSCNIKQNSTDWHSHKNIYNSEASDPEPPYPTKKRFLDLLACPVGINGRTNF